MFRSAFLILSGNAATSLLLLARNLIVARLITVEDYGIAATFAVAMAIVEMMSALGLQQQIVQAKDGDDPRFQAALQGFQLLRGVLAGAVLFAIAAPLARFMGIAQVIWAFQLMSLVPVLNALVHFDIYRLNRRMVFVPMILTGAVPALVSVLAVWPLSVWYGDYRVMLYAIITQAALAVVTSHLVAERRYRLLLDRSLMTQSLRFGWPLLVNGVLLFAVFNGDKLIVGRELGMSALALFSMGFTLTLAPTLVMAASAQHFFLPQLAAARGDAARFRQLSGATIEAILGMGLVLVAAVVLIGGPVVQLLLGAKYDALLPYMTWLAILQALRVFKAGPAIVALAAGHTGNAMMANLARVLSLPLAWYVAVTSGDLLLIIWIAILGETVGYGIALLLLRWRLRLALRAAGLPHLAAAGLLLLAGGYAQTLPASQATSFAAPWVWAFLTGFFAVLLWSMRNLRRYLAARGAMTFSA